MSEILYDQYYCTWSRSEGGAAVIRSSAPSHNPAVLPLHRYMADCGLSYEESRRLLYSRELERFVWLRAVPSTDPTLERQTYITHILHPHNPCDEPWQSILPALPPFLTVMSDAYETVDPIRCSSVLPYLENCDSQTKADLMYFFLFDMPRGDRMTIRCADASYAEDAPRLAAYLLWLLPDSLARKMSINMSRYTTSVSCIVNIIGNEVNAGNTFCLSYVNGRLRSEEHRSEVPLRTMICRHLAELLETNDGEYLRVFADITDKLSKLASENTPADLLFYQIWRKEIYTKREHKASIDKLGMDVQDAIAYYLKTAEMGKWITLPPGDFERILEPLCLDYILGMDGNGGDAAPHTPESLLNLLSARPFPEDCVTLEEFLAHILSKLYKNNQDETKRYAQMIYDTVCNRDIDQSDRIDEYLPEEIDLCGDFISNLSIENILSGKYDSKIWKNRQEHRTHVINLLSDGIKDPIVRIEDLKALYQTIKQHREQWTVFYQIKTPVEDFLRKAYPDGTNPDDKNAFPPLAHCCKALVEVLGVSPEEVWQSLKSNIYKKDLRLSQPMKIIGTDWLSLNPEVCEKDLVWSFDALKQKVSNALESIPTPDRKLQTLSRFVVDNKSSFDNLEIRYNEIYRREERNEPVTLDKNDSRLTDSVEKVFPSSFPYGNGYGNGNLVAKAFCQEIICEMCKKDHEEDSLYLYHYLSSLTGLIRAKPGRNKEPLFMQNLDLAAALYDECEERIKQYTELPYAKEQMTEVLCCDILQINLVTEFYRFRHSKTSPNDWDLSFETYLSQKPMIPLADFDLLLTDSLSEEMSRLLPLLEYRFDEPPPMGHNLFYSLCLLWHKEWPFKYQIKNCNPLLWFILLATFLLGCTRPDKKNKLVSHINDKWKKLKERYLKDKQKQKSWEDFVITGSKACIRKLEQEKYIKGIQAIHLPEKLDKELKSAIDTVLHPEKAEPQPTAKESTRKQPEPNRTGDEKRWSFGIKGKKEPSTGAVEKTLPPQDERPTVKVGLQNANDDLEKQAAIKAARPVQNSQEFAQEDNAVANSQNPASAANAAPSGQKRAQTNIQTAQSAPSAQAARPVPNGQKKSAQAAKPVTTKKASPSPSVFDSSSGTIQPDTRSVPVIGSNKPHRLPNDSNSRKAYFLDYDVDDNPSTNFGLPKTRNQFFSNAHTGSGTSAAEVTVPESNRGNGVPKSNPYDTATKSSRDNAVPQFDRSDGSPEHSPNCAATKSNPDGASSQVSPDNTAIQDGSGAKSTKKAPFVTGSQESSGVSGSGESSGDTYSDDSEETAKKRPDIKHFCIRIMDFMVALLIMLGGSFGLKWFADFRNIPYGFGIISVHMLFCVILIYIQTILKDSTLKDSTLFPHKWIGGKRVAFLCCMAIMVFSLLFQLYSL